MEMLFYLLAGKKKIDGFQMCVLLDIFASAAGDSLNTTAMMVHQDVLSYLMGYLCSLHEYHCLEHTWISCR